MLFTIIGAFLATITAIYSALTSESPIKKKSVLSTLAVVGLIVTFVAAITENRASKDAAAKQQSQQELLETKLEAANNQLVSMKKALNNQSLLLEYAGNSLGQLSKLNDLSAGKGYYVRLAFGKTRRELEAYREKLVRRFPGGNESKLIQVRSTSSPVGFELVFGTGLTLASAEVFQRLAASQGFANGRPEVRTDD